MRNRPLASFLVLAAAVGFAVVTFNMDRPNIALTLESAFPTQAPVPTSTIAPQPVATFEPGQANFSVDVQGIGTSNTSFTGGCLVTARDGSTSNATVDGITPKRFMYAGQSLSCSFQEQWGFGSLRISIRRDGAMIKTVETTTPYGIVSATV